MGDGKKLKSIIDERGITVTELARAVGMNQQTIYSIIKRDSKIRYDFALRIANELDIDVNEICEHNPFNADSEGAATLPAMPEGFNSLLDDQRVKRYMNHSLAPLLGFFGKENLHKVDRHLTNYYQLSDEGRDEVDRYIEYLLQFHKVEERSDQVKTIKKW